MLKTLKKAGLSLLSLAMTISMLTLTPMVKVSAAVQEVDKENITVLTTGGTEAKGPNNSSEVTGNSITSQIIKEALFDGNNTTYYQSATLTDGTISHGNPSLIIDLGAEYDVTEIDLTARFHSSVNWNCTGNVDGNYYVDLATSLNNDNTWNEEADVEASAATPWGTAEYGTTTVTFDKVTARYVRISADSSYFHNDTLRDKLFGLGDIVVKADVNGPVVPTNVAKNLPANQIKAVFTADGTNAKVSSLNDRPLTRIVNGNKSRDDYAEFSKDEPTSYSAFLQLDLGAVYTLSEIKAWFYHDNSRIYKDVVVLVSETETFDEDDYTVVFNGSPNDVHNLGLEGGVEITDVETSNGRTYSVENVDARYVRFYMYGSTAAHKQNHIAEIEVYGVEAAEEEVVDVTALEEAVLFAEDEYGSTNTLGQYTVASFAAYEAAYTAALAVISKADNNEALTQAEVDDAKAALEAAIAGLVSVEVLKENLADAKDTGEASDDWAAGYNKFMAPYFAAAEAVLAKEDASQDEVDVADEELANAAMDAVEFADTYVEVLAAIVDAESVDVLGKTEESVNALAAALQAAYEALESATDVDALLAQIEALDTAVKGLEDVPVSLYNKEALKAAIDAADAIFAALGEADLYDVYTEDSALAFETAYEEAKLTYEDDGTDYEEDYDFQAAIDAATEALAEATAALEENEVLDDVDKEPLVNFIEENEELYNGNNEDGAYTADSFAAFKDAYEAALAVIENDDATQDEVDAALIVAADALDELVEAVDKTVLKAALDYALTLNEEEYTPSTWANALVAYGQANAVYENADATQDEVDAAIVLLQDAQAQLVKRADKTALEAAIAAADAVEKDNYTEESVAALEAVYADAVAVNANEEATQDEVDEATAALDAAIKALVEKPAEPTVDKAALKAAIDAADALNVTTDVYTEESVEAFDLAYSEATVIYADEEVTQEAVDEAAAALLAAIDGLKEIEIEEVDKEALLAAVEEAEEIIENADAYTVESYVDFKAAYDAAVVVLDNVDATQEEVNNATDALEAAMEALVEKPAEPTVDKSALEAAIATADGLNVNTDDYTIDSVEAFELAYSEAVLVFADEEATQEAVDEVTAALLAAIDGLTPYEDEEIDRDALLAALEEAEEIIANADAYTLESYADFKAAYDAAVVVADNEDATQEEINNVTAALVATIEALQEMPTVDKTALEAAIATADALDVNTEEYTVESVEAFELAYSEAVLVFADEEATQEAVDEVTAALLAAIEGLDKVEIEEVDKEALLNALDDAEEIIANEDTYTEESYAAFKDAYDAAVVVADNDEATQAEVDAAVDALLAAVEALEEKVVEVLENLALNKTGLVAKYKDGTDAEVNPDRPLSHAVDGDKAICDSNHAGIGKDNDQAGTTSVYFQVDLEDVYEISSINLYRYWKDGRSYTNSVVVISETEDFANPTVIYNADVNNIHGFGAGTDASYVETSAGKTFNFDGVNGRYVRVYMSGSTVGNTVHIVELEVFGKEVDAPVVPSVDKTALEALIAEVEALNEADYSKKSWSNLQTVLTEAKAVVENDAATQEEVDATTATLQAKKDALVDISALNAAIVAGNEKLAEADKYTDESVAELQMALGNAEFVVGSNVGYVPADVEMHTNNVLNAIAGLVEKQPEPTVNKDALAEVIARAEAKLEEADKYTDETVAVLEAQLANAKDVMENADATQMDVDQAVVRLNAAINALKEKPVEVLDTKPLEDKIAEAKEFKEDEYYAPTFKALEDAIKAAEEALATVTTNAQVAEEVEKLQAVIDALIARPDRVVNLTAKATDYKTIQLNWDAVEGATFYQIYRLNTQTGKWIKFKTSTTNSYKVTGVKTGVKYSYRVIANKELADGAIVAGKSSSTKSATALLQGEPVLTMKANGKTKFDLSWTKVAGATRYLVYRKSETEGWKKILTLGGDVTTYTTSSMVPNTYTYMIKAARYDSKDRTQTNGSNTCTGTSVFSKPVITVTKATSTSAKVSWKAVEGVKYYEVYRATSKSGTYSKVKTTESLSFTSKSLKAGKTYYYKVRAYRTYNNAKVYTSYSKVVEYKA